MEKGNINGALKVLTDNMQNGILPLNDETLRLIHQKHPAPKEADADILLQGEKPRVHPVIYDVIKKLLCILKVVLVLQV